MNQQQLKYARERIDSIFSAKSQEVRDHFARYRERLTLEQKIDLVKDGQFSLVRPAGSWPTFEGWFVFEGVNDNWKEEADALATLRKEKQAVMDELMLGDNEKALEAIQAFAELKVI